MGNWGIEDIESPAFKNHLQKMEGQIGSGVLLFCFYFISFKENKQNLKPLGSF
jgi:hypothetical protein